MYVVSMDRALEEGIDIVKCLTRAAGDVSARDQDQDRAHVLYARR